MLGRRIVRTAQAAIKALICLASVLLFYLWMTASPIDAVAWEPGPAISLPTPITLPATAEIVGAPSDRAEHLAFDAHGTMWMSQPRGWVVGHSPQPGVMPSAPTGGLPMGLATGSHDEVYVAVQPLGLFEVLHDKLLRRITHEADGRPIEFPNGVAIAPDGAFYLTDSNTRFNLAHGHTPPFGAYDMLEMRPRGRLLRHDPATGVTTTVVGDLHFPNGLAVSPDGRELYVAETFRCRILAVDLATHAVRTHAEGLPAYPDNLAVDRETGLLWIAGGVRRTALHDWLQRRPFLRAQIAKLPTWVWRHPSPSALLLAVDAQGVVRHALADETGTFGIVTAAVPHGEWLYLASISDLPVSRVSKPR